MAGGSVQGFTDERYAAVREVFAQNLANGADIGASFCATVDGKTVVDLWGGFADEARTRAWEEDTIVNVYSTTKTMTALTALLEDRLDRPRERRHSLDGARLDGRIARALILHRGASRSGDGENSENGERHEDRAKGTHTP